MSRLVVQLKPWHAYALDGQDVPSVTGIIRKATSSQGLLKWAARSAAEWAWIHRQEADQQGESSWVKQAAAASDAIRDASALAGKQVHAIAQRAVWGEPVPEADPETGEVFSDDVLAMGGQVARFMDAWQVEPILVEAPVFHEVERWAGTPDLVADLRDGRRWLIDYKTGQGGIYPEVGLQTAAYASATHCVLGSRDMLLGPIDALGALWVRPDGWQLHPLTWDARVMDAWHAAQVMARWASLPRKDLVSAPLPVPERAA